ncbi:MAG TPA: alpha/beta hydrolase [Streptosporangiaceae bacterium]|jgi:pimeloyl-ACP methyl ester carboxylesterase
MSAAFTPAEARPVRHAATIGRAAAAIAAVVLAAACGSAGGQSRPAAPAARGSTSSAVSPQPSPSLGLDGCFGTEAGHTEKIRDPGGGGPLTLAVAGAGPRVIVMSNESDENLCSWLPVTRRLTAAGYRVVLWDFGGNLPPDELAGVVRHLRRTGATRIVLMGASEGAKTSLIAAARIRPVVQGVVSLSAESVLRPAMIVVNSVRHLTCPMLLITARQDGYGSAQAAPGFMAAARTTDKRLLTVPGTGHGTALLSGPAATATLPAITSFLSRHLR